jgi:hypothetical protein
LGSAASKQQYSGEASEPCHNAYRVPPDGKTRIFGAPNLGLKTGAGNDWSQKGISTFVAAGMMDEAIFARSEEIGEVIEVHCPTLVT